MSKLCILLHFYQPPNQQEDILMRIVNECYLPLTEGLLKIDDAKLVVNISGCLTELLMEKGYSRVIDNLRKLAAKGCVEFTGSAMYHAFLPLIPEEEIVRQVAINNETNIKYFGDLYRPSGFFSPEMAVNSKVLRILSSLGYKWIAAPQLSYPSGNPAINKLYKYHADSDIGVKVSDTYILFRNKRVSSLILSAICKDSASLYKETMDMHPNDSQSAYSAVDTTYLFAVMDAETFGHHRIGHEKALFNVLNDTHFKSYLASDLVTEYQADAIATSIRACTWTNEEQDFWLDVEKTKSTDTKAFILWNDPSNPIHTLQWQLLNSVLTCVTQYKNKNLGQWTKARLALDRAISSDQFWWASAKPWWSLEMIEEGAYNLKEVLSNLPDEMIVKKKTEVLYRKILDKAFEWQRTGYIRKKHLENSSTYLRPTLSKRTPSEWYNQLILEFEDEMNVASAAHNFEKAIKWRDALTKLQNGNDIYDVLHVVDELWSARNLPLVKPFLEHTWEEFSAYAKEHFKDVSSKEEFERWKKDNKTHTTK